MTLETNSNQFLWCEKYRPKKIDDCVLPKKIQDVFIGYRDQGRIPNLLLHSGPGQGKSTISKALCNEVGAEVLFINGSEENGIDVFRNKILQFASTVSLTNAKKVVLLDESDHISVQGQAAARGIFEAVSSNCSFILTCNYKHKIIEPIHSRCSVIDFSIEPKDRQKIAAEFFKRATSILKQESVDFDPAVVAEVITKYFPDYRRIINELQRYSVTGKIDTGILTNFNDENYKELVKHLANKDFTSTRKWVSANLDIDSSELFRMMYDKASTIMEQKSIPQLVMIIGEYQYKAAFAIDQEINTMAALTEIMSSCSFKA